MRKYIIGAFFGIALTLSASAFADEFKSLIGLEVKGEMQVYVDKKPLENSAIIVNDVSYLPVRNYADSTGYKVTFNGNERKIMLDKEAVVKTPITKEEQAVIDYQNGLEYTNSQISFLKGSIAFQEAIVDPRSFKSDSEVTAAKAELERLNAELTKFEAKKAELEKK
ncbi:hypothetical protein BC351_00260 [Paenibacillus ferrarius]|uniref:Copper amine oxidase-like N-terminal domain-containing protein n=1 Tax=Paenibacillus ferrarius TaxID=1469647 RepID=A0A1V4HS14_9BACL|nr:hypothetical protein [Paenibacillus ferrarius]OPH61710.1 hypothetical protein BC351_00260 [Paenibacillus ferrarius]